MERELEREGRPPRGSPGENPSLDTLVHLHLLCAAVGGGAGSGSGSESGFVAGVVPMIREKLLLHLDSLKVPPPPHPTL